MICGVNVFQHLPSVSRLIDKHIIQIDKTTNLIKMLDAISSMFFFTFFLDKKAMKIGFEMSLLRF